MASAAVPGGGYGSDASAVVMPGGGVVVTYTSAGLTRYAVGPHRMARTGTSRVATDRRATGAPILLAHPSGRYVYLVWDGKVQVFDASPRTPRLVRTLGRGAGAASFAPDGRRLYLSDGVRITVLGTRHGARPTKGVTVEEEAYPLVVSSDGSTLVAGGRAADGKATVSVYALPRVGAPTLVRTGEISVPGWPDPWPTGEWVTAVDDLVAPGAQAAYVSVGTWGYGDTPDEALLRVRLDALSTVALPDQGAGRTPFLQDVSADGKRVYVTYGGTTDEDQHVTRSLGWTGPRLATLNRVGPLGDVVTTAVSKAGATRGLVYVMTTRAGHLRLSAVDVR
ncbi:hypothetical protein ACFP8W_03730 [Nocardioides hankookensis]